MKSSVSKIINIFKRKTNITIFLLLLILVFLYYFRAFEVFFQADEWHFIGWYTYRSIFGALGFFEYSIRSYQALKDGLFHIAPLSRLVFYIQSQVFQLNTKGYILVSLLIHSINSYLIYVFSNLLSKNKKISLFAAVIFAILPYHFQAVTLISTYTPTELTTLFVILTMVFFYKYLMGGGRRTLILGSLSFFVALLFKESSVMLYVLLPLMVMVYKGKTKLKISDQVLFWFLPLSYFFFRFYMLLKSFALISSRGEEFVTKIVPQNRSSVFLSVLERLLMTPLKGLSQAFLPYTVVKNVLIVWVFLLIVLVFLIIIVKKEKKIFSKYVYICLSIIISATFPFIFLPGPRGSDLHLDSRSLYTLTIGSSMIIGYLVYRIPQILGMKRSLLVSLFVLVILATVSYLALNQNLKVVVKRSKERRAVIEEIMRIYPKIDKKTVFYVGGWNENGSISGFFNSGFAWNLKVLYKDDLPPEIFKERDSYYRQAEYQGFEEASGYGFGYFYDIDSLREFMNSPQGEWLALDDVKALYFDGGKRLIREGGNYLRKLYEYGSEENIIKSWVYGDRYDEHEDERWIWFDLRNELAMQRNMMNKTGEKPPFEVFEKNLYSAKSFTHEGWTGGLLEVHTKDFSGEKIVVPQSLFGYPVVHLSYVKLDRKNIEPERVVKTKENWEIVLPSEVSEGKLVSLGFMVAVHQAEVLPSTDNIEDIDDGDVTSLIQVKVLRKSSGTNSIRIEFTSPNEISSLPHFQSTISRPVIYVDGEITYIDRFELSDDRKKVTVVLKDGVGENINLELPVFVRLTRFKE